jgi:hypothetical protein
MFVLTHPPRYTGVVVVERVEPARLKFIELPRIRKLTACRYQGIQL